MSVSRLFLMFCLLAPIALSTFGCSAHKSNRPLEDEYIIYPSYWARHVSKVCDDFHKFRIDIDRTVFGLEDVPVEQQ